MYVESSDPGTLTLWNSTGLQTPKSILCLTHLFVHSPHKYLLSASILHLIKRKKESPALSTSSLKAWCPESNLQASAVALAPPFMFVY